MGIFVAQWNHNIHQKYLLKSLQIFKFGLIKFLIYYIPMDSHLFSLPLLLQVHTESHFSRNILFFFNKKFYILLRDLVYLAWEDNGTSHYCILFKNSRDGMYIQNFPLQTFLNEQFNDINCNDSIMQHCHYLFSKIFIAPNRNSVTIKQ